MILSTYCKSNIEKGCPLAYGSGYYHNCPLFKPHGCETNSLLNSFVLHQRKPHLGVDVDFRPGKISTIIRCRNVLKRTQLHLLLGILGCTTRFCIKSFRCPSGNFCHELFPLSFLAQHWRLVPDVQGMFWKDGIRSLMCAPDLVTCGAGELTEGYVSRWLILSFA